MHWRLIALETNSPLRFSCRRLGWVESSTDLDLGGPVNHSCLPKETAASSPPMTLNGSGKTSSEKPVRRSPQVYCTTSGTIFALADSQSEMLGLHPKCWPLHLTTSGNGLSGVVALVDSLAVVGKLPLRSVSEFLLAESKACPRVMLQSTGKILNTIIANVYNGQSSLLRQGYHTFRHHSQGTTC